MVIPTLTPVHFSSTRLDNLPANVLGSVLFFLPINDIATLSQVNKKFCRLINNNDQIWAQRLENMGLWQKGLNGQSSQEQDVSDLFKSSYKANSSNPRSEFIKIYKTLQPLYLDLLRSGTHTEPLIFRLYQDPTDQARILSELKRFSQCDPAQDSFEENVENFNAVYETFENAALSEFEFGYDSHDITGKVSKYAKVLVKLNGGASCVQLFTQKHNLVADSFTNPSDMIDPETKTLKNENMQAALKVLAESINNESQTIDKLFPPSIPVLLPLCSHVIEDNIIELFNEIIFITQNNNDDVYSYLETVPYLYVHMMRFINDLKPSVNSGSDFRQVLKQHFLSMYSAHVDQYLDDEYQEFANYSAGEMKKWTEEVAKQDLEIETFLLSNVTKEKDKKDILTSFKRVLMKPVSVIPFGSITSSTGSKSGVSSSTASGTGTPTARFDTSVPLPTTELDAKAAVMKNKLEGISALFSLELTLNTMRHGRDAVERTRKFISAGGQLGEKARGKCEDIFVKLVRAVGGVHVKDGFEKAMDTLKRYDVKTLRKVNVEKDGTPTVQPLAIFAELVNIGDLIQQMIHVFYEEELAVPGYVDRLSFISPANREKKKFEKMLDSYVANGMNRGIDVLMEQIDYVLLTEQLGTDFNPVKASLDISPTKAATDVVSLLDNHVNLLSGSTEKSIIDVFQQEVAVRFFGSLSKHIKRQIISVDGSVRLLSDLNLYYNFILSLKQRPVIPYFMALKEIGQLFLIDGKDAKAIGQMLSDMSRFNGIFQPEEVFEFAQRREDWLRVRKEVEKVMYGFGMSDCVVV